MTDHDLFARKLATALLTGMKGSFSAADIKAVARSVAQGRSISLQSRSDESESEAGVMELIVTLPGGRGLVVAESQVNVATLLGSICAVLPAISAVRAAASFESLVVLIGAITSAFASFTKEMSRQEVAYIMALNRLPGGWQSPADVLQEANYFLPESSAIPGSGKEVVDALRAKGARLKWRDQPPAVLFQDFVLNKPLTH